MERDSLITQMPPGDEGETDNSVSGEADAEEESADVTDQVAPSPLPSVPVSAGSSTFVASTIDIRLQIQPEDGHPDGRRIRNVISVNGQTLRIGALRANQLNALVALLHDLDVDQAMERLAQFLTVLSEQQAATTHTTGTPVTQPAVPTARSSPAAAVQAPVSKASPTPTHEEKPRGPDQRELSPVTTVPGNPVAVSNASPPVASVGAPGKEASSPETKPEQLALF